MLVTTSKSTWHHKPKRLQWTFTLLQLFSFTIYKMYCSYQTVLWASYICHSKYVHVLTNSTVGVLHMAISNSYPIQTNYWQTTSCFMCNTWITANFGQIFSTWLAGNPISLKLSITIASPRTFINMHVTAASLPAKIFIVHQCVTGNLKLYLIKQLTYFFITLLSQQCIQCNCHSISCIIVNSIFERLR